ncbi:MAG: hypothetical protein QOJ96_3184 [Alphaproteobacteria bacterium]|nr:hypothetical protein [Alphaproteobacteria bacterium]
MNHSMYGADRVTHLKIVVLALIGATLVAGVGIAARGTSDETALNARYQPEGRVAQGSGPIVRAGQPVVLSTRETTTIR